MRCSLSWLCLNCQKVMNTSWRTKEQHVCGEYFCRRCTRYFVGNHECYIQSIKTTGLAKASKNDIFMYIAFDIETCQESMVTCSDGYVPPDRCDKCKDNTRPCGACIRCTKCKSTKCGSYEHVPNLVVADKWCMYCWDISFTEDTMCSFCGDRCNSCRARRKKSSGIHDYKYPPCENGKCGLRRRIFYGFDCVKEFCKWLVVPDHAFACVLSHNSAKFDGYFILRELLSSKVKVTQTVVNGGQLLFFKVGRGYNIRFIEFLPYALPNYQTCLKCILSWWAKFPLSVQHSCRYGC